MPNPKHRTKGTGAGLLTKDTNILITGVTGLIGGELVRRLLGHEVGKVFCLIRPNPMGDARARLIERLRFSADDRTDRQGRSLEPVTGDVASPRFGLSDQDESQVAESVDMIIHCASELSFIHDERCRETNITGMHNLIDLARRCERRPLIVHLSTATSCGAVSHQCLGEDDGYDLDNGHHNEYTRSKAMAERVLRDSGEPCLILRPSITLSAGISARKFARAIVWFVPLLREFAALPVDPDSRVDIVPVAFVAESIMRLLQKPQLKHDCYNVSAGPDAASMCGPVSAFLDTFYKRVEPLILTPPSEWTKEKHRQYLGAAQQRKLFSTFRYYLPFLNMDVVYDNARLRAELGDDFPEITPVTEYLGDLLKLVARENP
ncbi:MAG: NAD-dependent epimerase/dehydratase family protein [Phycisphaerales bacterium]|nr:NAD-dependent epimerase/dehydratase family protein [Phycisphaerales bacterium]